MPRKLLDVGRLHRLEWRHDRTPGGSRLDVRVVVLAITRPERGLSGIAGRYSLAEVAVGSGERRRSRISSRFAPVRGVCGRFRVGVSRGRQTGGSPEKSSLPARTRSRSHEMFSDHPRSQPPGQVIADRAPGSWPSAMDPVGAPVMIGQTDYSVRFALVTVASLVVAAFLIRMWFLQSSVASGNFVPLDPDHYMRHGRELARGGLGWQWTLDAIRYKWEGRTYLLPPLYPCFCRCSPSFRARTLFGRSRPDRPARALGRRALRDRRMRAFAARRRRCRFRLRLLDPEHLGDRTVPAGTALHSIAVTGICPPASATSRAASPAAFACAGAAFGIAALTRSMPVYFVIPAAIGYGLAAKDDPRTPRRVAALVAGFVVVTGAYSLWLSAQVGRWVFIENHGGISLPVYGGGRYGAVGFPQMVGLLIDAFASAPVRFVETWSGFALALFNLHGDRWLLSYQATSASEATVAKLVALTGIDLAFAASVLLAPIGIVLARLYSRSSVARLVDRARGGPDGAERCRGYPLSCAIRAPSHRACLRGDRWPVATAESHRADCRRAGRCRGREYSRAAIAARRAREGELRRR